MTRYKPFFVHWPGLGCLPFVGDQTAIKSQLPHKHAPLRQARRTFLSEFSFTRAYHLQEPTAYAFYTPTS
jgi:hypothetical protein